MTRKAKILLFLAIASALIFVYLIISSGPLVVSGTKGIGTKTAVNVPAAPAKAVDLKKMAADHQAEMTKILDDYSSLVGEISADDDTSGPGAAILLQKAEELKSRIAGLRAPTAAHKDTHLNLVLSIDSMENFINDGDEKERESGLKLMAQAQKNFEALSGGSNWQ